jgi:hypothetical protein
MVMQFINKIMAKQQARNDRGRFDSPYKERRGDPINFRLPISLDQKLRDRCGNDRAKMRAFIEEALREKLE